MREIKFRGLTKKKVWVFGSYIKTDIDALCIVYGDGEQEEIIPESVGQFTGLKDKNGKEIYEGDILTKWDKLRKKVFFSQKHFNFQLAHLDNKGFCDTLSFWNQESTEIIGNIHSNPELLCQ